MWRSLIGAMVSGIVLAGPAMSAAPTAAQFAKGAGWAAAALAPSGRQVLIARSDEKTGDLMIVRDLATNAERAVYRSSAEERKFIREAIWKGDERIVFVAESPYNTTHGYDYTLRLYVLATSTGAVTPLLNSTAPSYGGGFARLEIQSALIDDLDHVLVQVLTRRGLFQLWSVDLNSGKADTVETSDGSTYRWYVDQSGRPVLRQDWSGPTRVVLRRDGDGWKEFFRLRRSNFLQAPLFDVYGPGPNAGDLYVYARPEGRDLGAIYLFDPRQPQLGAPVYEDAEGDSLYVLPSRRTRTPLIGCSERQRTECTGLSEASRASWTQLRGQINAEDDVVPVSASDDDSVLLVNSFGPRNPGEWHIFDTASGRARRVLSVMPDLQRADLATTGIVRYHAADGAELWGYVTRTGGEGARQPLVVMPHGGPEARDSYGYDWVAQFLATRGYTVFQPNFRGSSGAGNAFASAGYGQWGQRMQADVIDGVRSMIAGGAVDPDHVCVVGGSYGGHVALMAAVQTPELFKCVVSIAGVTDLEDIVSHERENGPNSLEFAYAKLAIGNPNTDRDALQANSPLRQAARIRTPTLLIHGQNDNVVPYNQSVDLHNAMVRAGLRPEWMAVKGGHQWGGWPVDDRQKFLETLDNFLGRYLRGSPQP